jgi:hypothetical protein
VVNLDSTAPLDLIHGNAECRGDPLALHGACRISAGHNRLNGPIIEARGRNELREIHATLCQQLRDCPLRTHSGKDTGIEMELQPGAVMP